MLEELKIGVIGAGKMGLAIAGGLRRKYGGLKIYGYDKVTPSHLPEGFRMLDSALTVETECDVILLCVKPQDMKGLCQTLSGSKKYISIAAGLSLDTIRKSFSRPESVQIARVMPNLPALVGEAVSGFYAPTADLASITSAIFDSIGKAVPVDREELLHAVTGLSGSGPAYVFSFIHALAEGGVLTGLPYDRALELATRTVLGAARMVLETGEHPALLRNRVTSPGGTTIHGLRELESSGFQGIVMDAVESARNRSEELGN